MAHFLSLKEILNFQLLLILVLHLPLMMKLQDLEDTAQIPALKIMLRNLN